MFIYYTNITNIYINIYFVCVKVFLHTRSKFHVGILRRLIPAGARIQSLIAGLPYTPVERNKYYRFFSMGLWRMTKRIRARISYKEWLHGCINPYQEAGGVIDTT